MNRLVWADRLKGCLIVLVVLGHAIQHALGQACEDNHLWNIIYSFHMPAFMAVSGYLSCRGKRGNLGRRFLQLVVPFLAWTLIMFFVNPPYEFESLHRFILYPDKSFWFLWVLFWIVTLFWVGDWLAEKLRTKQEFVIGGLALVLVAAMVLFEVRVFGFQFIAYYFLFYAMGYYLRKYPAMVTSNKVVLVALTVVWAVLSWFWTMHDVPAFMSGIPMPKTLLNYGYRFLTAGIAVYVLLGAAPTLLDYRWKGDGLLVFCGVWSLGIYTAHLVLLPLICRTLKPYLIGASMVVTTFVLALAGAVLLVFLLTKFRWTRKVLLGKYERRR